MSLCAACGHMGSEDSHSLCPACKKLYEREVKQEKKFPPGLSEEAKKIFTEYSWARLKEVERKLQTARISMEEAQEEMKKIVRELNAIPRINAETMREREAAKKLKLY